MYGLFENRRAFSINNYSVLHTELNIICKIATSNNYLSSFVEMLIGIKISKWYNKSDMCIDTGTNKKKKMFIEVPFVENSTRMFKSDLQKFTSQIRPDSQLTISEKSSVSVQNLFNFKNKIPNCLQSDVVYNVQCKDCGYGKTKRQAYRRLYEYGLSEDTYRFQSQSLSSMNSSSMPASTQSVKTARAAKIKATQKMTQQVKLMNASDQKILKEIDDYSDTNIKDGKSALQKHVEDTSHTIDWEN
ncbi:unnamed protein product, partial [Didymodactylos carnosus]